MIISVSKLQKFFRVGLRSRKVQAVSDITFEVQKNEVFGFVGPNGSGKSTTISLLLGLVKPTSGGGTLFGQPLGSIAARRKIGYLPELPNFYGYLTANEMVQLSSRLAGINAATVKEDCSRLLKIVGLESRGNDRLQTFSKGMLQRVGLAQAIAGNPELVILDEPMSGLDPLGRHLVRKVLLDLKNQGKTVFFSSHVLPDIEALCDRVALIDKGRTVLVSPVQQLVSSAQTKYEVQIKMSSGGDLNQVPFPAQSSGDLLTITVDSEQALPKAIRWGQDNGTIAAISPIRQSLEEVLVETLQNGKFQEPAC